MNPTTKPYLRYFARDCRVIDRETGQVKITNHPTDFGLEATNYRMRKAQQTTRNDVKFCNRE